MNFSVHITTEGYTRFYGCVYLWNGQSKHTLWTGPMHEPTESFPAWRAERLAYLQALRWFRQHFPAMAPTTHL